VSGDVGTSSRPTYFGREHEAVRHDVARELDASCETSPESSSADLASDDGRPDTETVVTTLGIVLTIPTES